MGKIKTFASAHVTFDAEHELLKLRNFSHNPVLIILTLNLGVGNIFFEEAFFQT
tara:strand:- start:313 stop:474 length:162 start_codon:yes stop_codon:yes gene_type:complete